MKSKIITLNLFLLALFANPVVAESKREVQFENDKVKVWKTTIPSNDTLKMHRHDHARIIVGLKGGSLQIVKDTGKKTDVFIETGKAYWFDADPKGELHGDLNVSPHEVQVMLIEFKD